MKKLLIACLTLFFGLAIMVIPASAKKIGDIKDNVFTDYVFKYSFEVPDGWSSKLGSKPKVPLRITLTEKSYPVPQPFQGGNEDYAQVPTITVLADTTSLDVDAFIKFLTESGHESKQRDYFLSKLRLISKPHDVIKSRDLTLQGDKAVILDIRQAYEMEVAVRGTDRADIVNDYKFGNMFVTVRNGIVYVIHMITEYQTSPAYAQKWGSIVGSLKFDVEVPEK